eukprot:3814797-Rhodomonas_salina.1
MSCPLSLKSQVLFPLSCNGSETISTNHTNGNWIPGPYTGNQTRSPRGVKSRARNQTPRVQSVLKR